MADRSIKYSELWLWYGLHDNLKEQIIHTLNLPKHLPIYTPDMQVEVLTGAPDAILKAHAHLLHDEAKVRLGLKKASTKKTSLKEWSWMT